MTSAERIPLPGGATAPIALPRRRFLQGGLVLIGGTVLGSCGGGSDSSDPVAPQDAAEPPSFAPYTGVSPDLPGDPAHHVPDAFFRYPADPPPFFDGRPGNGGTVHILTQAGQIGVPLDRNTRWQKLNESLGVELTFEVAMPTEWDAKQSVTLAGGDLPDIMQLKSMAQFPRVLDSEFADLTEFLSGDAIENYPALAAIPSLAWKTVTVNGRIFGIPQSRPPVGPICSIRGDLLDEMGVTVDVSDGQDFLDLCRELTDPARNRWAIASDPSQWSLGYVLEMMSAPNRSHPWSEDDGAFTSMYETEQMPEALDVVRGMWEEGLLHPDSFTGNNAQMWHSGSAVIYFQAFPGWGNFTKTHPQYDLSVIPPMRWDGGGPAPKLLTGGAVEDFMAFKKADAERVQELLRIADYLAAPFGSQEFLLVNYGIEGEDYTLDGTDPVVTEQYLSRVIPTNYIGSARNVPLYVPGVPDVTRAQHEFLSDVLPSGAPDPTVGLYSETAGTKGATEDRNMWALQGDIVQGRRPVSDWAGAVEDWKRSVGDKIRQEYEEAFAAADA
ncbi:extracellular solute-binding protein [Jiangella asiatica]|uniref:Extracellular solute-binding protein n=1 Tax=Jiangella asiatica TaxID=2530372 RepID=A0A4R5DKM4_9ACTN|nr:extracellular solute-binding protein [Jiangella asiatica]TDE11183.1 hypothetical protein E1269_09935 [Jiangella asiatica]